MSKMRKILSRISEGTTFDALSRELGMRKSTTKAIVNSMLHTGYIEEIQYASGCSMCPLNCNSQSSCGSGIRMYTLTDKGMDYQ